MKQYIFFLLFSIVISMAVVSCTKDLNSNPIDPNVTTTATVYNDPAAYKESLAKLYAGLSLTGQYGPAASTTTTYADIQGIDEGTSQYIRQFFNCEDLSTDEAVWTWSNDNGGTIADMHFQTWTSANKVTEGMYYRIFYQIALCNEFVREVGPRVGGLSGTLQTDVYNYLAEARFLRALSYYHALDLFKNVPFVTEKDPIGIFYPKQVSADSLFNYLQSELISITDDSNPIHLVNAKQNEYARADKACAWALLAKMYLNAEVYLGAGKGKYNECATYCNKVLASGYSLHPSYPQLFMADNNNCTDEIIFPVTFDGSRTQSYGGTNYLVLGSIVGSENPADRGMTVTGWLGLRVTKAFVQKFGAGDQRAMFYKNGQNLEINDIGTNTDGYGFMKYTNKTSTGGTGVSGSFVDTDYPMIRLADVYLMYAEAVLRGATTGDRPTALNLVNQIRNRATAGAILDADLTLDFILDERSRELSWECTRRTDLVRYGRLTNSSYIWPWKGNVAAGIATDEHYNVFALPASDLSANPNLNQNPGY